MKTILYATDCTKKTAPQLKYAYRLSQALKAELHTVHVYDLSPLVTTTVRSRGVLERNFETEQIEILEKFCTKHLKKEFGTPKLNYHAIKNDSISKAIAEIAEDIDASLVLVGAKNPYSLRGVFTENIANELMISLPCPILILPEYVLYERWTRVIYATDFEASDIQALEKLTELIEPFEANVEVIHIPRKLEDYHRRKMEWFKAMIGQRIAYAKIIFSSRRANDVESGIHDFIDKDRPEILVMMERQRDSFLGQLLHKDLVKTMESEINIPLMVFNKQRIKSRPTEAIDKSALLSYTL